MNDGEEDQNADMDFLQPAEADDDNILSDDDLSLDIDIGLLGYTAGLLSSGCVHIKTLKNKVKSLQDICLSTIDNDTEKYMAEKRKEDQAKSLILCQSDWVAALPWNLLEPIISTFLKTYQSKDFLTRIISLVTFRWSSLRIFQRSYLEMIEDDSDDNHHRMPHLGDRGWFPHATSSKYSHSFSERVLITVKDLSAILINSPNLTELDASCNDGKQFHGEICRLVGRCCPNILKLNVAKSKNIDDENVTKLWDIDNNPDLGCHKLTYLDLRENKVTIDGLVAVLTNLKSLECVRHGQLNDALQKYYNTQRTVHSGNDRSVQTVNVPLKLSKFSAMESEYIYHGGDIISTTPDLPDLLRRCMACCPYLTEFTLHLDSNMDCKLLATANNLKKIVFMATRGSEPDAMVQDVSYLLQQIGGTLTDINLSLLPLPLHIISKHCSHVERIAISAPPFDQFNKVFVHALFGQKSTTWGTMEKLKSLWISGFVMDLSLISTCCPNLRKLHFEIRTREAHLSNSTCFIHSSSPGATLPMLESLSFVVHSNRRELLQSSELYHLLLHAPNLVTLSLRNIFPEFPSSFRVFMDRPHLKAIALKGARNRMPSEKCLHWLVSGASNIRSIYMSRVAVDDAAFHRLMNVNSFLCLENVELKSCGVSIDTPKMLMLATPEDRHRIVTCITCSKIAGGNPEDIEHEAEVNGWVVTNQPTIEHIAKSWSIFHC